MSMNILNDISKVYMEQVASNPDFLDLDKDGNKKESMKKASKEVEAPKERLKTDRNMFSIPKGEQEAARERLLAKARAKREKMKESLDPVGQEDSDIDNDGDTDSSDKYLHKRRKAIGKAIAKKSVKESSYYDPMDDDDFDHDGFSNLDEFIAGVNPTNSGSVFAIDQSEPTPAGYVVRWNAVEGRAYSVYWAETLSAGFSPLASGIPYPQNSYTDTVHTANDGGFYYIDVQILP